MVSRKTAISVLPPSKGKARINQQSQCSHYGGYASKGKARVSQPGIFLGGRFIQTRPMSKFHFWIVLDETERLSHGMVTSSLVSAIFCCLSLDTSSNGFAEGIRPTSSLQALAGPRGHPLSGPSHGDILQQILPSRGLIITIRQVTSSKSARSNCRQPSGITQWIGAVYPCANETKSTTRPPAIGVCLA